MSTNLNKIIDNDNIIKVNSIIAANCFDLSPNFNNPSDVHQHWEFIYIDSGEVCYTSGDKSGILKQGDIVFHPPGEIHSTFCNGKQSASFFNIIFDCRSEMMSFFVEKALKVPQNLTFLLKKIIEECNSNYYTSKYPLKTRINAPLGGTQLAKLYIEEFLILMLRAYHSEEDSAENLTVGNHNISNLTDQVCKYLSENIYDRVTLQMLTQKFHFGKSHLCDQFKNDMGCSIMSYYLDLKIAEAKRLLREEDVTIRELSERLKFESPEYFSRYFRKCVGHSPRDFRNMLINDSALRKKMEN